ncbi:hypothetical protein MTO96_016210 [Rhipicephalus appendiculatus]
MGLLPGLLTERPTKVQELEPSVTCAGETSRTRGICKCITPCTGARSVSFSCDEKTVPRLRSQTIVTTLNCQASESIKLASVTSATPCFRECRFFSRHRCSSVAPAGPAYPCTVCGCSYERRDLLDQHVDCTHFKCSLCPCVFAYSSGLVAHLVKHSLELA